MLPTEDVFIASGSGLRPGAGVREDALKVKSSAEVQGLHLRALAQPQPPQAPAEWGLAAQAVLLDTGCSGRRQRHHWLSSVQRDNVLLNARSRKTGQTCCHSCGFGD